MAENESLAEKFSAQRKHLNAVAYRMLGTKSQAEDAVQEAWLRLSRTEATRVNDLRGWLTTVVARVCLDMLRARKSRPGPPPRDEGGPGPDTELILADSVGLALLVVLETLDPAERVAFVLHDLFDLPFEEIAQIVGRSPAATRQLASRARRRVKGSPAPSEADLVRQRGMVDAFLAASRHGDFDALIAVLDPEVVLTADSVAIQAAMAAPAAPAVQREMRGSAAVAAAFKGRARGAVPALVNGAAGAAWAPDGNPRTVFDFAFEGARISEIHMVMDPARLAEFDVELLGT